MLISLRDSLLVKTNNVISGLDYKCKVEIKRSLRGCLVVDLEVS